MAKVAVVFSGSGHMDGTEVREAVLALLALDKRDAEVQIFAPDIAQTDVINHLTGKPMEETRNVLVEAARIARGKIKDLSKARAEDFDAIILPGGYGAAKNLSNLATTDNLKNVEVLPALKKLLIDFMKKNKPIGVICISPAVLTAAIRDQATAHVTIGEDPDNMIAALGGEHQSCSTRGIVIDDGNHIVSTSAYMRGDARLTEVASGIDNLVEAVLNQVKHQKRAA